CSPRQPSSELQTAFASGIGQRLDAAMEQVPTAIEHDGGDTGLASGFRDFLADLDGGIDVGTGLLGTERRGGGHGTALRIIDDLRIDVPAGAVDRQPRTAAATLPERGTDPPATAFEQGELGHLTSSSLPCGRCTRRDT